jgi:hypothetical protein
MSDPSAGTEPESPPAEASGGSGKESQGNAARAVALIVGVLIGMGIGLGLGMGLGSAARKRMDRWSVHY